MTLWYTRKQGLIQHVNIILYNFIPFAADYVMAVWLKSRGPPDVWEQAAFNDLMVRREALLGVCLASTWQAVPCTYHSKTKAA